MAKVPSQLSSIPMHHHPTWDSRGGLDNCHLHLRTHPPVPILHRSIPSRCNLSIFPFLSPPLCLSLSFSTFPTAEAAALDRGEGRRKHHKAFSSSSCSSSSPLLSSPAKVRRKKYNQLLMLHHHVAFFFLSFHINQSCHCLS